jgi:hypothetical protein
MDGDDGLLCPQAVGPLTVGQRPSTGCNQCWAVVGESVDSWLELTVLGDVELQVAEMNAQESRVCSEWSVRHPVNGGMNRLRL